MNIKPIAANDIHYKESLKQTSTNLIKIFLSDLVLRRFEGRKDPDQNEIQSKLAQTLPSVFISKLNTTLGNKCKALN
jgi:hypothetical protein